MITDVIIEYQVTGFLPISAADAEVLEYMTNIDCKSYASLLGSKYKPEQYLPILERIQNACSKVLSKKHIIQKALKETIEC